MLNQFIPGTISPYETFIPNVLLLPFGPDTEHKSKFDLRTKHIRNNLQTDSNLISSLPKAVKELTEPLVSNKNIENR